MSFNWGKTTLERAAADLCEQMWRDPGRAFDLANHYDGHVREAAVKTLYSQASAAALVVMIERMNDWVWQVRQAAQVGYDQYLLAQRVDDLLECANLLVALQGKSRADHSERIRKTLALFVTPQFKQKVLCHFCSLKAKTARFLLRVLLDSTANERLDSAQIAMEHPDASVRKLVLNLMSESADAEIGVLLEAGLYDHSATVRTTAFRLHLQRINGHDELVVRSFCESMLLDYSHGLRAAAGWYAKQAGLDVVEFYRDQFARVESLSTAQIEALLWESTKAELKEAIPLAKQSFSSERVRTRLAAMSVLLKLAPDEQPSTVHQGLQDASPKIRSAVIKQLRTSVSLSRADLEGELLAAATRQDVHTLDRLLELFAPWHAFGLLLLLLQKGLGESIENYVFARLQRMNSYSYWFGYQHIGQEDGDRLRSHLLNIDLRHRLMPLEHLTLGLQKLGVWGE